MTDETPGAAGLVWYRENSDDWSGTWSHPILQGQLGTERVAGATPGVSSGSWPVEVRLPDGTPIFRETLQVAQLGVCLQFSWKGKDSGGAQAEFSGLGYRIEPGLVVATFQQVKA